MKALLISDTHRGFSTRTHRIHAKWGEELATLDFDVLILAGDLASHKKHQFEGALRFFREIAGSRPIVLGRGNHDLWDENQRCLTSYRNVLQHEWFSKYDIHHLESGGPFWVGGDVAIVGWDGWYAFRASSNDLAMMNRHVEGDTWAWLQREAWHGIQSALIAAEDAKKAGAKVVCVTHFPLVPGLTDEAWSGNFRWWEMLAPHLDVFCCGHSHRAVDTIVDGVRVVNCGSDYDDPKYTIIEI